ncbi:neuronal tyrosine-phosphorylated phosphoinositide-3-kinase adapter 1-like [Pipra filicauda]|uniref:Neuronal tyrosine-phosphorylated phosphoinositide-3-kinase adapter 1-like n=1 Tax=Pipra filicauda TaxID=649802 RepID=A0A6J2FYY1_9PASS|nr:neuronal tyrosine-phosphorylated phosphoinositide-3-kinase adapter 1-like [Pipra filicauda]
MSAPPRSELAAAAAALLRLGEERPPAAAVTLLRLGEERPPAAAAGLLQRKGRPEWRPREEEPRKGAPKARDGGSLRRPLRVGFLTLPAPQERGPRPCTPGMAPRSLSCHAVGLPDPGGPPLRPPPGPRTGPPEGRGLEAPPAKRGGTPRGGCVRQTPPLKPSRSPQTRLSGGAPPPPPPSAGEGEEGEEPVYIEMVGDARGGLGGDPRRGGPAGAPPPPPEEPEAIYEEMSCPLPAGEGPGFGHTPFTGHTPFRGHASSHGGHAPFSHYGHSPYAGHAPFSGHPPHTGRTPIIGHAPFSGPAPIPPPFPNLLPPRPPPLAPPPEVASRLPLPQRREAPPPARARSHSTPLPPHHAGGAGRERGGGAGLGPLPLPPPPAEAPPPGKRPPSYDSLRGGVAAAVSAPPREEDPPLRRVGGASSRRGKEPDKAPEPPREERGGAGAGPPPSGIPVRAEGPRGRPGPPVPCQTFPACGRASELPGGPRLGRSASTSGVRQAGAPPFPRGPHPSRPLSGGVPSAGSGGPGGVPVAAPRPRDGQLQEVIDRKRCVCTEIKARGGRGGGLCKQDSLPPLPAPPAWKGGGSAPDGRPPPPPPPPGTPPARRPHAVLWDTAI